MSDDDIIKSVDFGAKDEFCATAESMKRNEALIIECSGALARIYKASYDAYIEAGFTEDQALMLCKN